MKRNKFVGKLILSVLHSLLAFHSYWRAFDGAYSDMDLLWGGVVTVVLSMAIFMYEPVAKKIQTFSFAWFFGLLIVINLLVGGWIISDPYFLRLPLVYRAWGEYMLMLGILLPITHQLFHYTGKRRRKGSFFKRIRLSGNAEEV